MSEQRNIVEIVKELKTKCERDTLLREHGEMTEIIGGLVCERCTKYDAKALYWYHDLGGWTRIFCDKHVPKTPTGEMKYGASQLPSRPPSS